MASDPLNLEHASLAQQAASGYPLRIPWSPIPMRAAMCFHSTQITGNALPFSTLSPFEQNYEQSLRLNYRSQGKGSCAYSAASTATSASSSDHLSAQCGISIGCGWLGAEASGSYDKSVNTNRQAIKISKTGSCRTCTIEIDTVASLSPDARRVLQDRGLEAFKVVYGDYFIAGYQLGADAGVMSSQDAAASQETESYHVQVTVHFAFWSTSETWSDSKIAAARSLNLTVTAFSTLKNKHVGLKLHTDNFRDMQTTAEEFSQATDCLDALVEGELLKFSLPRSGLVSWAQCRAIFAANLVVELILMPVSSVPEILATSRIESRFPSE